MSKLSVLKKFNPGQHFFTDPFPHVVIRNCLDDDIYQRLYENFPVKLIKDNFNIIQEHTYRCLANDVLVEKKIPVHPIWQEFFEYHTSQDYFKTVIKLFEKYMPNYQWLEQQTARIRNTQGDTKVVTDTQFVVHQPYHTTTRTTHIDNPIEFYAGLLYFRQRGDRSSGGDFMIYDSPEIKDVYKKKGREIPENISIKDHTSVPYKENTFVMFLNSNKAVHGVTPRVDASVDRLSVNIIGEYTDRSACTFRLRPID